MKNLTQNPIKIKIFIVHHDVNIACVLKCSILSSGCVSSLAYSEEIQSSYQLIMVGSTKPCRFLSMRIIILKVMFIGPNKNKAKFPTSMCFLYSNLLVSSPLPSIFLVLTNHQTSVDLVMLFVCFFL